MERRPPATSAGVDVDAVVGCERRRKTTWKGGLSWSPDRESTAHTAPSVPLRWKAAGLRDARGPNGPGLAGRRKRKRLGPSKKKKNPAEKRKEERKRKGEKIYIKYIVFP